ncbi:MAG: hypothetical protein HQL42_04055 [Alphaproteobacteria bacterium]|nr:hypothetical protein [Alphaproteobacteria bacterium]
MAINKDKTDRKVISVPKEMSDQIAAYWHERMLKSEAEAIRQLIERGLTAWKAEGRGEDGAQA